MRASIAFAGLLTLTSPLAMANPIVERYVVIPGSGWSSGPLPATTKSVALPVQTTTAVAYKPSSTPQPAVPAPIKPAPAPAAVQEKAVKSKAPSINDYNFKAYSLNAHNGARKNHGAPFLSWDPKLAKAAQVWANDCRWEHSGGKVGPYGENMLGIYIPANQGEIDYPTYNAIYNSWYKEELVHYNFNKPGFSHATGHMTQVVWKGTTKVGCAWTNGKVCNVKRGKDTLRLFKFVCEYQNQGNIMGGGNDGVQWFRENVLRTRH